jgi:hypothetical protein
MSQLKTVSWTNPATAVARNVSVGFAVARVQVIDVTNGANQLWVYGMPNASHMNVATSAVTLTNGFTPLAQQVLFAAPITAVTRAADTVFTCSFLDQFSFAVGDRVKATAIADDGTGLTLNADYTVLSVSATAITCSESTASGFSAYVSGGFLSQISNASGVPYPTVNVAVEGGILGTGMVGANGASMVAIFEGQNPVV